MSGPFVYLYLLQNYFRDEASEELLGSIFLLFHGHHKHARGILYNVRFGKWVFIVLWKHILWALNMSVHNWNLIPRLELRF